MDNVSLLPPAYDFHHQQMFIGPETPPSLPPPPPAPALSHQSINYLSNCDESKPKVKNHQQNLDRLRNDDYRCITNETIDNHFNVFFFLIFKI